MVVLTSAGCNTLDYLLDAPAEIHAVDVNPRQNALLQLKLALIEHGEYDDLFTMFGCGSHRAFRRVYAAARRHLPGYAQAFWDDKIRYFDDASKRRSFYYYGTSGAVAWIVSRYLITMKKPLARLLFELLDAHTLDDQKALYQRIEPQLWTRLVAWLIKQPLTLSMLGVPRPQIHLIDAQYPGGVVGYVADKLKHVFTEVLIRDNYFWRAYLTGSYTDTCCPNYLKPESFALLRARANRVRAYNCTVSEFLERNPGEYSHFILLDHQDWLAWHKPTALQEEWRLILANSRPGGKVLMRSASQDVGFLPDWARASLRFFPDLTGALHRQDRVGTYGSLHLAEVR
ncbi:MAG: BtaA family protein [Gammaproteobacteria bacterium]